jgi:hypothetical protein
LPEPRKKLKEFLRSKQDRSVVASQPLIMKFVVRTQLAQMERIIQ